MEATYPPHAPYYSVNGELTAMPVAEVASRLAARGLPICLGELDFAPAVPTMLAELREQGFITRFDPCWEAG